MIKKPLKRSRSGFEVEFHLLNSRGEIEPSAHKLLKLVKEKKPKLPIIGECAMDMIEIHSFPKIGVYSTALNLVMHVETVLEMAEREGFHLYPFALYPGKYKPRTVRKKWYLMKEKVFGKDRFKNALRCAAFHYHYTLPRGVFDKKRMRLKRLFDSKIKQTLVDSYNMLIAMDPILTTFMQSSPFLKAKYLGKDSRILIYRGGRKLKYMNGLYSEYQQLGGLQPYKHTCADLIRLLDERHKRFKRVMAKKGFSPEDIYKFGKVLDFSWNPVKINKLGTLEYRGMDMNHISYVIGTAIIISEVLRAIQQNFLRVFPSDVGIKEPFRLEEDGVIIPPHTIVRHEYQYLSAWKGLDDDRLYDYCKRFMRFAAPLVSEKHKPAIRVIEEVMEKRETMSDRLIKEVRKAGYELDEELPNEFLAELSLKHSHDIYRDMWKVKKMAEAIE